MPGTNFRAMLASFAAESLASPELVEFARSLPACCTKLPRAKMSECIQELIKEPSTFRRGAISRNIASEAPLRMFRRYRFPLPTAPCPMGFSGARRRRGGSCTCRGKWLTGAPWFGKFMGMFSCRCRHSFECAEGKARAHDVDDEVSSRRGRRSRGKQNLVRPLFKPPLGFALIAAIRRRASSAVAVSRSFWWKACMADYPGAFRRTVARGMPPRRAFLPPLPPRPNRSTFSSGHVFCLMSIELANFVDRVWPNSGQSSTFTLRREMSGDPPRMHRCSTRPR